MPKDAERVAVIGAGIAGLASAYLLTEDGKNVTLFESEAKCGGHALTVDSPVGPVDLGFQVCNLTTYPHLMGFLRTLGVDTEPSDMSFALSTPSVEWGSRGLKGMLAQPGCLRSPRFMRMWLEIIRFSKGATEVLEAEAEKKWAGCTLGDYLRLRGYSAFFTEHYVVPMCAAIWSCSDDDALAWPIISLVRFWKNHHLLSLLDRPVWRVLKGRSRAYVDAVTSRLADVRTGAKVTAVRRLSTGGVEVTVEGSPPETFNHVVLATHADTTLRILGSNASPEERAALANVRYQDNTIYLHSDTTLMPRERAAWASWNCLQRDGTQQGSCCVSYWVNLLQNLPEDAMDVFVTLNPPCAPDPAKTYHKLSLAHPLLNFDALSAQQVLSTGKLQGSGGVWYAGAWCGYGFHEDGIRSAVEVAARLSGRGSSVVPWEPVSCEPNMTLMQRTFLSMFQNYGAAMLPSNAAVRVILPNGGEFVIGKDSAAPADTATVRVLNGRLFSRVVMRSDIGLGEAFMDGDFITDDLFHMIEVLSRASCEPSSRTATFASLGFVGGALYAISERLEMAAHHANTNTETGSARNISYHYDAGNEFYKLFLDQTMMYSSGVHKGGLAALEGLGFAEREAALEAAQYAKLDSMIEQAQLKAGEHVLEIGCGWGAFAIRMAQKAGVRVTGITVSREQLREAMARVEAAGLTEQITLLFCDYRKVEGVFDKVVSIEMLEAVGHEHLPTFFDAVSRYLKPGGIATVQVITLPDDRYKAYCEQHSDFIRTYIFPGGHLPSLSAMVGVSSRLGLELSGVVDIGPDYAVTLRLWRERMLHYTDKVLALGYPKRFLRMYEFYFAYCEAGFANGLIHDYQITWTKSSLASVPSVQSNHEARADVGTPLDSVTAALLVVWAALFFTLIYFKNHVAIVAASFGFFLAVRKVFTKCGVSYGSASTMTGLVAALLLTVSSLNLFVAAANMAPEAGVNSKLRTAAALAVSPSTPDELLGIGRLIAGMAAGFAALRTWECVREPRQRTRQRSLLEALSYTASLVCTSVALSTELHLVGLAMTQICEGHSLLLRARTLGIQRGRGSHPRLWAASWIAFVFARALPHLILLVLFSRSMATVNESSNAATSASRTFFSRLWSSAAMAIPARPMWIALIGLIYVNINNGCIGWGMLRAQIADGRTVALANTQHRSDGPASSTRNDVQSTSPPRDWACVCATVILAFGLAHLTALQEPECARLVGATSVFYVLFYALLRFTGFLQPRPGTVSAAAFAEWRSRVCSTVNALLLIVGSVLCFSEWPYAGQEGWISAHIWSHPVTFASLFVGFLQVDLLWCVWHLRSSPDVGAIVHHCLFVAITHYVLWGWYFKQPFAWLSLAELSTPFLNGRWFLAVTGCKDSPWYSYFSYAFAVTFLATRVVGYSLGLLNMWACRSLWQPAARGLHAVVAGCHVGWVLNMYWSTFVISGLVRANRKSAPKLNKQA